MHDYLVYHAKARTEGINIFQYTRVGLIDKIMQYIYIFFYFIFSELFKLFGKGVGVIFFLHLRQGSVLGLT